MTSEVMGTTTQTLKKENLNDLLKETKETLAVDVKTTDNNTNFSLVDLWNVQKRQRTTANMMRRRLN
jgi:hypothetical protein